MADKFLLVLASGDIDEDEALTKLQMLKMLAGELGYSVRRRPEPPADKPNRRAIEAQERRDARKGK